VYFAFGPNKEEGSDKKATTVRKGSHVCTKGVANTQ